MQKEKISNWDLVSKLLNDNESEIYMEIHMERDIHGLNLYLIFKNMPEYDFYLPFIWDTNKTIKENVNDMSIYSFKTFYDKLNEIITKIKDIKVWHEELIEEYKMDIKNDKI